jgi:hypothetical protein
MTFKRTAALVASSVALLLGTVTAPAIAAEKVSFLRNPATNCERGADSIPGTGSPSASYVITQSSNDSVAVEIKLRDGAPDATYNVFVIQTDGDLEGAPVDDCSTPEGTLTTDDEGVGDLHLKEAKLSGANSFHVYLYSFTGGFHLFDTRLIPFQ